jgi:hypothetical protein
MAHRPTPRRHTAADGGPHADSGPHADKLGISDQYVILDTFLKRRDSDPSRGDFRWNFMVQGVTSDEAVGVRSVVGSVIEIQIGTFSLRAPLDVPYVLVAAVPESVPLAPPAGKFSLLWNNSGTADTAPEARAGAGDTYSNPWRGAPLTSLPFGRFTLQIREAGLQSFSDRGGARHNFEFTVTKEEHEVLTALPVWDKFTFTEPLHDIHGISLVFRNPDIPISFLPDCLYDVTVRVAGGYLSFGSPSHGLLMGERIFISGFKSRDLPLNAYVNRVEGHIAARAPPTPPDPNLDPGDFIGGDTFYTDPAILVGELLTGDASPLLADVAIASRRMRIPVRMRCLVDRQTNHIAP